MSPAATATPVAVTRPPTVALSADNIQRLKSFPRPPRDNGIGLHFHLDLRDQFIEETVSHLKSVRATWTLIYAQDELQTERAARACFAAGIMPVVRIGKLIDEPTDPTPYVEGLRRAWKSHGWGGSVEPLYVQLFNEPEDPREWVAQQVPADWAEQFGRRWAADAPKVVNAGAFVGIQVLDRPGFDRTVDAVNALGQKTADRVWRNAFFAHHNYGQNHPPAYPYDAIKQQTDPGKTILEDWVAALRFLAHAHWMQERIGFVLPIIGGEGGWWLYNDEDKHYPKVEWPLHAQYTKEMYEWLRTGVLSNGEPLPDYLFSITSWIAGSWTFAAQNWWGNALSPTGRLDQTIEAMQSMPEFVRRFSWDEPGGQSGPTPVVDPHPGENPASGGQPEPDPNKIPGLKLPPLDWDPALDTLGVRLERAEGEARWRLVKAEFWDDVKSDGRHHIYVKALRADGQPAPAVPFVADWIGRTANDPPVRGTTDFNGDTNLPMFIPFDPIRKDGIMYARVEGANGDVVRGMGLPFNHHVSFVLTFQEA